MIAALALLDQDSSPVILPLLFAVYTVARWRGREEAAFAAAIAMIGWLGGPALHDVPVLGFQQILSHLVAIGLALAAGLWQGARGEGLRARERAERLDRERELLADRAVSEERTRIAQELHDIVAHNVTLMVVEAEALGASANDDSRDAEHRRDRRARAPGDERDAHDILETCYARRATS